MMQTIFKAIILQFRRIELEFSFLNCYMTADKVKAQLRWRAMGAAVLGLKLQLCHRV